MKMIEIGNDGLLEANLILNQNCSRSFTVIHKDENGDVIDHSQSSGHLAIQKGKTTYSLDDTVVCGSSEIVVSISPDDIRDIKPGEYLWDFIVEMHNGENIRLIYGEAYMIDTYALD